MVERIKKHCGRKPCISKEMRNKVVQLYNADDLTCAEIADVCGISLSSVFRIMREETSRNGE